MNKRRILILLCCCLLLTGCSWSGKRYTSVTPHQEQRQDVHNEAASAANSLELIHVLEDMIRNGTEDGLIHIGEYPVGQVESGMAIAVDYALKTYPLGAYAVEEIQYEVGTTGGLPAMAVKIAYRHSDVEIRQIQDIERMDEAEPLVAAALADYDARLVMRAEMYFETDFQQMVRSFAETYPETVMEIPQVTVAVYGIGPGRVVELSFAYQTGRDSLRQMQSQVKPVFEAAELYVSGSASLTQKYSQLYAFLMERFDYQVETSITPAYSLLQHGVGDSRAFATVHAAMCRRAGLECLVVTGTRSGEPWVWNMVRAGDVYQHVDLLRSNVQGRFREMGDREMGGYVWDYSTYPECPVIHAPVPVEEESVSETEPGETLPDQPETAPETVPDESEIPQETTAEEK